MKFQNNLWESSGFTHILLGKRTDHISNPSKDSFIKNLIYYGDPPYPFIVTYKHLLEDLDGDKLKDNERTRLLQNIIKKTVLKKGTILLPINNSKYHFFDAVLEIKDRSDIKRIIIFGLDAADIILDTHLEGYRPYPYKGIKCLILPSLEEMLPDNKTKKKIAWEFLKNISKDK